MPRVCASRFSSLIVLAAACGGEEPQSTSGGSPEPGAAPLDLPCALEGSGPPEPYPWYPALDLSRVPFHAAAGAWGPAAPISAPAAPVTTRSIVVHTATELGTEALVPGTEIVVGSDILEPITIFGDVTDVDIVVPRGRAIGRLYVGRYTPSSTTSRVRIRGPVPMTHSGGRVGQVVYMSNPTSDIIIDGVDLNGEDGEGGAGLFQINFGATRGAIINVRGHATGGGSLQGASTDLVIAGSTFFTGARPRIENGSPEGWGLRGGDRVVVFQNYIAGTRYHRVRVHPAEGATQYAWIVENVFVDPYEARIASAMNIGGPAEVRIDGFWAQCNEVYAHSTCMTGSFDGTAADYAQLTHNSFFGSIDEALQTYLQGQYPSQDYLTGNAFGTWAPPPAYPGPGDPREVPLPDDDPTDDDASLTFLDCPGPT